jgi:hypothetical protein
MYTYENKHKRNNAELEIKSILQNYSIGLEHLRDDEIFNLCSRCESLELGQITIEQVLALEEMRIRKEHEQIDTCDYYFSE